MTKQSKRVLKNIKNKRAFVFAKDVLPRDVMKIVYDYLPDIIIDGIPKLNSQVSLNDLNEAKNIHFYSSFVINRYTRFKNLYRMSGIPIIATTSLTYMFIHSKIKSAPDIGRWDVSNVRNMAYMFCEAKYFNKDISNWDVSNVQDMTFMFYGADAFDCDLSGWNMSNLKHTENMLDHNTHMRLIQTVMRNNTRMSRDIINIIYEYLPPKFGFNTW